MIFKQVSLEDLMAEKVPSFSAIVTRQNEAEVPTDRIDPSQWAKQTRAVYDVMKSGTWFTKAEIAFHSGASEHAVSARLSDLKKEGILSQKRKAKSGSLYQYRLLTKSHADS